MLAQTGEIAVRFVILLPPHVFAPTSSCSALVLRKGEVGESLELEGAGAGQGCGCCF